MAPNNHQAATEANDQQKRGRPSLLLLLSPSFLPPIFRFLYVRKGLMPGLCVRSCYNVPIAREWGALGEFSRGWKIRGGRWRGIDVIRSLLLFHVWVTHRLSLHTLCFWAFEIDTTALAHTVVSSPFIPWPIVCGRQSPRSYFPYTIFFFFSQSARMKRNKRFRHCTYNLSRPLLTFFFSFSPLLLCYLFICVGYVQSQSDARCHCCAEGNAFARPPGFSRFFFCATLAKPFKRYWQCLTYKSSDWIQPSPPLVNPIPVFLCRLMRLSL